MITAATTATEAFAVRVARPRNPRMIPSPSNNVIAKTASAINNTMNRSGVDGAAGVLATDDAVAVSRAVGAKGNARVEGMIDTAELLGVVGKASIVKTGVIVLLSASDTRRAYDHWSESRRYRS